MQPVTIGRIVLYSFINKREELVSRPAIVVDVFPNEVAQLQVFIDNDNDISNTTSPMYKTSVAKSDEPQDGCWSWMPFQKDQQAGLIKADVATSDETVIKSSNEADDTNATA